MRILIVDDDRKLARQLKKGLDEHGHSVTVAFDGPEGIDAAEYGEFDVLVLGVMLPGLDGISIVRRLRAAGRSTPILLLTARDAAEDVVTGLDAGADDYPNQAVFVQDPAGEASSAFKTQDCGTADAATDRRSDLRSRNS